MNRTYESKNLEEADCLYHADEVILPIIKKAIARNEDIPEVLEKLIVKQHDAIERLKKFKKGKDKTFGCAKDFMNCLMDAFGFDPEQHGFRVPFGNQKFYDAFADVIFEQIQRYTEAIRTIRTQGSENRDLQNKVKELQYFLDGLRSAYSAKEDESIRLRDANIAFDKHNSELYNKLLNNLFARQKAESELERITAVADWKYWAGLAQDCAHKNDYDGMELNYRRAIAAAPDIPAPYLAFADSCRRLNLRNRSAVEALSSALDKCKEVSRSQRQEILEQRAYHSKFIGNYGAAFKDLKKARGLPVFGWIADKFRTAGKNRTEIKERIARMSPAV